MTNIKLLPCPFCGGKALLLHEVLGVVASEYSYIKCSECGCGARTQPVVISTEYCSDEEAAKLWNRRTYDE